uniref:Cyclic nucleotide-binding domain-containing protein n=1 Tax=Glossina brevipalpis TaxID=37001 RepID=A0A1A9WEH3_9MUSC
MQITNCVSQVGAITVNGIQEPCDRNLRDVELISCRLRRVEPLCRLPSSALQQLAMCGFYEDLEKGVTCKLYFIYALWLLVFRAGEQGRFWYAVLGGSLEVRYHATDADGKVCLLYNEWLQIRRSTQRIPNEFIKGNYLEKT